MNRTLLPVAIAFGTSSLLLLDSAIKGAVILAIAALLVLLLRRDSAATRHLIWLVAMIAMLVVPLFSAMLPRWQVLPAWVAIADSSAAVDSSADSVAMPSASKPERLPDSIPSSSQMIDRERPFSSTDQHAGQQWSTVPDSPPDFVAGITANPIIRHSKWFSALPLLWAIGFSFLVLRLIAARWMLRSTERGGRLIAMLGANDGLATLRSESDQAVIAAFEGAYQQLGIRQSVRLLIHPERSIPVVWGIRQFRLLLPELAQQWSADQLRSVLLHELAHIKRRDTLVQLLTQAACALHWFNPLVWVLLGVCMSNVSGRVTISFWLKG